MATLRTTVTPAVKDVKSTLSLADGTSYVVQYQGKGELRMQSAPSAPSMDSAVYFRMRDGDTAFAAIESGGNLYMWTQGGSGAVVLDTVA